MELDLLRLGRVWDMVLRFLEIKSSTLGCQRVAVDG